MELPSLLIVGHPRGLTSATWEICVRALSLNAPACTTQGEILNSDRNPDFPGIPKFSDDHEDYSICCRWLRCFAHGFVIKDVLQPRHVGTYVELQNYPHTFKVLFVDRDPAEVKARQLANGWDYPDPAAHVELFKQAADAVVTYDGVTTDCNHLFDALASLGYGVQRYDYMTETFVRKRERQRMLRAARD